MRSAPELTRILFCRNCGFRFFDRGLSETEASRYYDSYRSETYFLERNSCEPFYTRRIHRQLSSWLVSEQRRQALAIALSGSGAPEHFETVLDFGGSDGSLIEDIPSTKRVVFDLSGATIRNGIGRVSEQVMRSHRWNLVVCAQVLEHVSDPHGTMSTLADLLAPNGWLYLEVPDEMWSNRTCAGNARHRWLGWLVKKRKLLMMADTISTACRILLGFLPPFGFIPMREHLQYFTEPALVAIAQRSGLHVVHSGRNAVGQIYVTATNCLQPPSAAAPFPHALT